MKTKEEFKENLKKGEDLNKYKFYKFLLSICDDNMKMLENYQVELKVKKKLK